MSSLDLRLLIRRIIDEEFGFGTLKTLADRLEERIIEALS